MDDANVNKMPSESAILHALSLRRVPNTISIRRSDILPPQRHIEHDPIFAALYREYLQGHRTVYLTRISLGRIRCGFYRESDPGQFQYFCDEPPPSDITSMTDVIRQGDRSVLYIYSNPNKGDCAQFVSPDDVAVFRAYESLGVKKVPVVLLSTPEELEESALGMRHFRVGKESLPAHLVSSHPGTTGSVPAFVGSQPPEKTLSSLQILRDRIADAQQRVRQFHTPAGHANHYHHTLYSTLFRLDETLRAVMLLLERDMWHQAVPLLRTLYETSLNFYLDWLAPQQMCAFFAMAAVLDSQGIREVVDYASTFERPDGTRAAHREIRSAVIRTFEIVRSVRKKAELSPLGLQFYKNMYSFMSAVTHQDFEIVANFAHTLDQRERPQFERRTMESLLMSADLIVAKVVIRILDDVSNPPTDGGLA